LFRFLPFATHAQTLRKIGGWLKPNGRIVFSASLTPAEFQKNKSDDRADAFDAVRRLVEEGVLQIDEPKDVYFARLDNLMESERTEATQYETMEQLHELFGRSELKVQSVDFIAGNKPFTESPRETAGRVLAVLASVAADGQ
jgi:hypothetical protein